MRGFYPETTPHETGLLDVGDGQQIYYEVSGNPDGKPAVYLHGGPGGASSPDQRRVFDPARYRIVLFDQRGCGHSTPHASEPDADLTAITTWHNVADIEALRAHLGIDRWLVCGGSWGSALALAYAQQHPDSVTELVLRGIFLLRREEIQWFYQEGASFVFPDAWQPYLEHIPVAERDDLLRAYHRRLTSDDAAVRLAAAKVWSVWEGSTSCLVPNPELIAKTGADEFALAFARIECHYFVNDAWLTDGRELLAPANIAKIRAIPTVIVQGRYDVVCPAKSAWDLHRAFPESDLRIVPDAGHAAAEPGTVHELVSATDRFAGMRASAQPTHSA